LLLLSGSAFIFGLFVDDASSQGWRWRWGLACEDLHTALLSVLYQKNQRNESFKLMIFDKMIFSIGLTIAFPKRPWYTFCVYIQAGSLTAFSGVPL
jgi:hypothetical protein